MMNELFEMLFIAIEKGLVFQIEVGIRNPPCLTDVSLFEISTSSKRFQHFFSPHSSKPKTSKRLLV